MRNSENQIINDTTELGSCGEVDLEELLEEEDKDDSKNR